MEQRKTNKKKLVVALAIIALIVVASVITTVVLVLAASQQGVKSNVNITYSVTDVSATVEGKYGVRVENANTVTLEDMGTQTFEPAASTTTSEMSPSGTISLSSTQDFVVFEYKFTAKSARAFTIGLTYVDDYVEANDSESTGIDRNGYAKDKNVNVRYTSNASQITDFASATVGTWSTEFNGITCQGNASVYVYVYVAVADLDLAAGFSGAFNFVLSSAE